MGGLVVTGLLVYLVSGLPQTIATYLFQATTVSYNLSSQIIPDMIAQIGAMLAMPIQLAVNTLMYYDLRVRKEGFDLELMAQQLARASGR
jgi:hypothetical protein